MDERDDDSVEMFDTIQEEAYSLFPMDQDDESGYFEGRLLARRYAGEDGENGQEANGAFHRADENISEEVVNGADIGHNVEVVNRVEAANVVGVVNVAEGVNRVEAANEAWVRVDNNHDEGGNLAI